jgi:hypothetical protein
MEQQRQARKIHPYKHSSSSQPAHEVQARLLFVSSRDFRDSKTMFNTSQQQFAHVF